MAAMPSTTFDNEDTLMLRLTRSLALIAFVATTIPAAHAWPIAKALHMHPKDVAADNRVTVHVHNDATMFRDIQVAGHIYTVLPHHGVSVTAPVGTQVFAASRGMSHRKGDLLVTISPAVNGETIALN